MAATFHLPPPPSTADLPSLPSHHLVDIAAGLAAAPDLWCREVHHDPVERQAVRLMETDRYDVWLIGWMPGQHTTMHDHGRSAGALAVVEGGLEETRPGGRTRTLGPGDVVDLPGGLLHDVAATGAGRATSIHVYSPPLTQMTYFGADGPSAWQAGDEAAPSLTASQVDWALHPAASRSEAR